MKESSFVAESDKSLSSSCQITPPAEREPSRVAAPPAAAVAALKLPTPSLKKAFSLQVTHSDCLCVCLQFSKSFVVDLTCFIHQITHFYFLCYYFIISFNKTTFMNIEGKSQMYVYVCGFFVCYVNGIRESQTF